MALCCCCSGPYYPRICFLVPLPFKTDLWSLSRKISASDLADMKIQETRQSPTFRKINQELLNMTQRGPAINNQDNHKRGRSIRNQSRIKKIAGQLSDPDVGLGSWAVREEAIMFTLLPLISNVCRCNGAFVVFTRHP